MSALGHLIAEAVTLGGGNLCANGHDWQSEGARSCPEEYDALCGQAVYRCSRCGEYDYGAKGGPGWTDCQRCEHQPVGYMGNVNGPGCDPDCR